ncbi:MAG: DUF1697 domain-containing protein [Rhodobacter sp.]|nr:DUF1697 domain-containing protein [Rhodobacter sp.]
MVQAVTTDDIHIALLRGVNVGGHGKLPMAGLRAILTRLGARDVATYIQSGNAVFRGAVSGADITAAVAAEMGFRRDCLVLSDHQLGRVIANNPFDAAKATPKALHFCFLGASSNADQASLDAVKAPEESCLLTDSVLYLNSPGGISASKLAGKLDRLLGVPVTVRNWNTVSKLAEMARLI